MLINNRLGFLTLCKREIWRFMKVWNQTVIAPVITALLFLAVLNLALGRGDRLIDGIPYTQFIAPGLIMMAVVQNAFANTSSSLMLSKIQGVIIVPITLHDPLYALFHIVSASVMMALFGVLTGVWSQTFDQLSAVTNYVITPLAFLSGTFYSIKALPEFWQAVCHFNPFFYMIDGFRYAMIGYSDSSPALGLVVMTTANIILLLLIRHMINRGYRLKQ